MTEDIVEIRVDFICKRCELAFKNNDTSDILENQKLHVKMKVHEQKHDGDVSDLWQVVTHEVVRHS